MMSSELGQNAVEICDEFVLLETARISSGRLFVWSTAVFSAPVKVLLPVAGPGAGLVRAISALDQYLG